MTYSRRQHIASLGPTRTNKSLLVFDLELVGEANLFSGLAKLKVKTREANHVVAGTCFCYTLMCYDVLVFFAPSPMYKSPAL